MTDPITNEITADSSSPILSQCQNFLSLRKHKMQTNNTRQIKQINCLMNFQKTQDFMQSVSFRAALIALKAVSKNNPEERDLVKMEQGWQWDSGFK